MSSTPSTWCVEGSVDRIEGDVVVLLLGEQAIDVALSACPAGIAEGDRVRLHLQLDAIELDPDATEASRRRLAERRRRLLAEDDGGDIVL